MSVLRHAPTFSWGVLALIHALPAAAFFYPPLISKLYGVGPGDTFLLLHHRAALFLAVLTVCVWAAFRSEVRTLATGVVAISMLCFLGLYVAGGMPGSLRTIAIADLMGLPFLAYAGWQARKRS